MPEVRGSPGCPENQAKPGEPGSGMGPTSGFLTLRLVVRVLSCEKRPATACGSPTAAPHDGGPTRLAVRGNRAALTAG